MKRGFTLVELVVNVVVIGVLATLSIASYQHLIHKSKAKVCANNLKVLQTAVKYYSREKDSLPATLSRLEKKHLEKAYAQVVTGNIYNKFTQMLVDGHSYGKAYAYNLNFNYEGLKNYGAYAKAFICPASDDDAAHSYGINADFINSKWNKWQDVPKDIILIADYDNSVFGNDSASSFPKRHKIGLGGRAVALYIDVDGEIKESSSQDSVTVPLWSSAGYTSRHECVRAEGDIGMNYQYEKIQCDYAQYPQQCRDNLQAAYLDKTNKVCGPR